MNNYALYFQPRHERWLNQRKKPKKLSKEDIIKWAKNGGWKLPKGRSKWLKADWVAWMEKKKEEIEQENLRQTAHKRRKLQHQNAADEKWGRCIFYDKEGFPEFTGLVFSFLIPQNPMTLKIKDFLRWQAVDQRFHSFMGALLLKAAVLPPISTLPQAWQYHDGHQAILTLTRIASATMNPLKKFPEGHPHHNNSTIEKVASDLYVKAIKYRNWRSDAEYKAFTKEIKRRAKSLKSWRAAYPSSGQHFCAYEQQKITVGELITKIREDNDRLLLQLSQQLNQ